MDTTANGKVWVSEHNARPEIRAAYPKNTVRFYDTTLRDGEQTVGVVLSPQQKLEIARQLDRLGVSRIEAGFPRVSPEDAEAIQLMQKAGLKAELWGFSRAVKADVEELVRLGLRASIIEAPTSDIKLKAYGIGRDDVLRRVTDARQNGITVAFFAVDGTRTDIDYLRKVYLAALEAGSAEIVVVDTIGACGPEAVEFLVGQTREWVGPNVPVHFHGHNDFGMATACALAAVRAGAGWIQGTINGMGERAGNADICEIALALQCLYDVPIALDLGKVREVSAVVADAAGYKLDAWKPLVGANLFMRESGAVASQFHLPEAIEPYSSELVGAERHIVLGKKSGLDSIVLRAKELGLSLSQEQAAPILAAVKKKAIAKRRLISDEEFRQIVEEFAAAVKS
jgi:isopropylmalate/homocitrate/citramalate synthase